MPSNHTITDIGAKSVIIKTLGSERMRVTVILIEFVDSMKLLPYVILS
jgi:hypothetical protein